MKSIVDTRIGMRHALELIKHHKFRIFMLTKEKKNKKR